MISLGRAMAIAAMLLCSGCASPTALTEAPMALRDGAWVTLGTAGGPVTDPRRSQPANLLVTGEDYFVVDAGDGVAGQLAAFSIQANQIDGVFISHLHMDHIAGLQGLIGLRWMTRGRGPLRIYGPVGTAELVNGLVQSMQPSARIGFGFGDRDAPPETSVQVIELSSGQTVEVGAMRVSVVENTHFTTGREAGRPVSLSYRFDLAHRSIGYTGDTGPSAEVEQHFSGVDLLVSEVIDVESVLGGLRRQMPNFVAEVEDGFARHLREHHLTPEDAGALADAAGARQLVLTHIGIVGSVEQAQDGIIAGARSRYRGTLVVARDLQIH